jgi:hypothetical protein
LAAGLLLAIGGILHPRVDTALEYEQGLAGMFYDASWVGSHAATMAGFAVLAISLTFLIRTLGSSWSSRRRLIGWAAVVGAGFAAVEAIPHLFASSEADALLAGESTPLTDLHAALQIVSTPAVGLPLAVLAISSAPTRALGGGWLVAVPAVLGGLAFAAAGPAIAITENSELSPLFSGAAGLSLWLVLSGLLLLRRAGDASRLEAAAAPAR